MTTRDAQVIAQDALRASRGTSYFEVARLIERLDPADRAVVANALRAAREAGEEDGRRRGAREPWKGFR